MTARLAGLLAGIAVAAVILVNGRVAPGSGTVGADVRFSVSPVGELEIAPLGVFLAGAGLGPDSAAGEGELMVRNQTGSHLNVRLRAAPSSVDLDDRLMVQVSAGTKAVIQERLGAFRTGATAGFRLAPGERVELRVRAWVPPGTQGHEGRVVDVSLQFDVDPERAAG